METELFFTIKIDFKKETVIFHRKKQKKNMETVIFHQKNKNNAIPSPHHPPWQTGPSSPAAPCAASQHRPPGPSPLWGTIAI